MAGNFDLNSYVQVNERIDLFYKKYPDGSIQTEIVKNSDGEVIIKAYAYRDREDTRPATGHARELEGSTYINKTSHIENCETSAVGRALAMLGFEIKKSVASQEEVANAKLQQEAMEHKPTKVQMEAISSLALKKGVNLALEGRNWTGKSTGKEWTMSDYTKVANKLEAMSDVAS